MAYYLIDFENVHSHGLCGAEALSSEDSLHIFYTNNSNSLSFDALKIIIDTKAQLQLFHVGCGGRNALDFQLSSFIGYIIAKEDNADIRIISNDNGFNFVKSFWEKNFSNDISLRIFPTIQAAVSYFTVKELPDSSSVSQMISAEAEETPLLTDDTSAHTAEILTSDETVTITENTSEEAAAPVQNNVPVPTETNEQDNALLNMVKAAVGETDDGHAERLCTLIRLTKDKQELYRSITKSFGMETGLRFYKALRPEYTNMRSVINSPKG